MSCVFLKASIECLNNKKLSQSYWHQAVDGTAASAGVVGPEIHAAGVRAADGNRGSGIDKHAAGVRAADGDRGSGIDKALQACTTGFSVRHRCISASTRPSSG